MGRGWRMGKMGQWFRGLLGCNKPGSEGKKKWGFAKSFCRRHEDGSRSPVEERRGTSYREGGSSSSSPALILYDVDAVDQNKNAIAVAAATAAVAEAAVASAQAAAAVVRLASSGRGGSASAHLGGASLRVHQDWAALKIQTAFRAYLARRALRALKGLVRMQALVRGHLVRKQAAGILRCMEAVLRLQARARDTGTSIQINGNNNILHHRKYSTTTAASATTVLGEQEGTPTSATPEKYDSPGRNICNPSGWWNSNVDGKKEKPAASSSVVELLLEEVEEEEEDDDDKSDKNHKIRLQIDRFDDINDPNYSNNYNYESAGSMIISPCTSTADGNRSTTTTTTTTSGKMMIRRGGGRGGIFTGNSDSEYYCNYHQYHYPNYMANTESTKAKLRSHSAPKQRPQNLLHRSPSLSYSNLQARFAAGKAYPGSGRLDTFGMPIDRDILGCYGRDATTAGRRRRRT